MKYFLLYTILDRNVQAFLFNTNTNNTDRSIAACHLVKLGRDILHLSCRHIYETALQDFTEIKLVTNTRQPIILFKINGMILIVIYFQLGVLTTKLKVF